MTDPRLLREGTPRLFDRALLESARDDRAPDGSEERARAALGIGAVAITGAAVIASQGASAPPAAAAVTKIATAVVLKWLGVGLAVTMVTAAPVTYLLVSSAPAPAVVAPADSGGGAQARAPSKSSSSTAAPSTGREREEPEELPAVPAALLPSVPEASAVPGTLPPAPAAAPRASSAASPGDAAPARNASGLAPELDVLDRARAALAAHDPAGARAALEEYQRRFPQGSMREEAELASIETLVSSGDTAGAHDAALRFLAAHPSSTYGARIRAIVKRTANP